MNFEELLGSVLNHQTYLEVQVRTGPQVDVLGWTTTDLMKPGNTVEENLEASKHDVQFLRELADELERQATPENIQKTMDAFAEEQSE